MIHFSKSLYFTSYSWWKFPCSDLSGITEEAAYLEHLWLTSSVSDPPTMLRPSPVRPLEISIVVSQPGMMGQVAGSEAKIAGVDDLLVPKSKFKMKCKQKLIRKHIHKIHHTGCLGGWSRIMGPSLGTKKTSIPP